MDMNWLSVFESIVLLKLLSRVDNLRFCALEAVSTAHST
jgi:hypothetical protein